MAYSITYDEQDTGFFSSNASAYTDAPNSTSTQFYLAPGGFNAAKGLLTAVSGFGDRDAYSLGFLYAGTYTFSASGSFWFYGSGYTNFPSPTLSVFDSSTNRVGGGLSQITVSISQPGTYFLSVEGAEYQSSQYEVSYTGTSLPNVEPSNITLKVGGNLTVGSIVDVSGSWTDANGLTDANSTNGYTYAWWTSSNGISTKVSTSPTYTISSTDVGKVIYFGIAYWDDAGYLETVFSAFSLISGPTPASTYALAAGATSYNEGTSASFTVTTTNVAANTALSYAITGVDAADITGGSLTGTTIVGANGQATISIPLAADQTTEGDETLTVTVQGQSASTTMKDTSLTPTIQFATTSGSANEGNTGSTTVTVQATLSAASTQAVTVPVIYSGSATQGTDYTNAASSINIPAGQTTGSATFSVVGDTTVEPNETVILTMGTPTNATLGTNKVYTLTVLNDDLDQQVVSRTNALTVLVDKGVLESNPVLLKDLVEEITTTGTTVTSHTVSYKGAKFKYSDIDALITTVIRNGEFTEEFRKEIVDQFPSFGGITYKDAVSLVGASNIDAILVTVAGADGNYVG